VTAAAAVSGISPPRPTKGGRKRGGAAALGGREAKRVRLVGDAVSVVDELSVSDAVMVPELLLLQRVLAALQSFFYFDSIGFLTKERFERVQKPLANVLSAELVELLGGRQPFLSFASAHVSPCVCEMSAAAGSDLLWKPLNHSLLLRTRDASAAVRLAALRALYACFERIGAEYVVLLPEMIPFMAELLEDSDEEVERLALQLKQLAEKLSGESLDPYLNA
jgi:U3 small nucleolar RNA-associated protein 10